MTHKDRLKHILKRWAWPGISMLLQAKQKLIPLPSLHRIPCGLAGSSLIAVLTGKRMTVTRKEGNREASFPAEIF